MKVSVIMPVYNCEKYLPAALNSILNQTEASMEVIVINDASTDNSAKVIEYYQKQYSYKMRVIHLEDNRGVSYARNLGLSLANGKYIYFMDADDVVSYNFLHDFICAAEKHSVSVVVGNFFRINSSEMLDNKGFYAKNEVFFEKTSITDDFDTLERLSPAVWNKIFLHDLIGDYKFLEGTVFEDIGFIYPLLLKADNVVIWYRNDYAYRYTPNSIMESSYHDFSKYADILKVANNSIQYGISLNLSEDCIQELKKVNLNFVITKMNRILNAPELNETKKRIILKKFVEISRLIFGSDLVDIYMELKKYNTDVTGDSTLNLVGINSKVEHLERKLQKL